MIQKKSRNRQPAKGNFFEGRHGKDKGIKLVGGLGDRRIQAQPPYSCKGRLLPENSCFSLLRWELANSMGFTGLSFGGFGEGFLTVRTKEL